jgi:hypothetical protein
LAVTVGSAPLTLADTLCTSAVEQVP